jgi:hypothetical protein
MTSLILDINSSPASCPACEQAEWVCEVLDKKRAMDETTILSLQAKIAELSEELEEWRMTNKIDELYRELDAEKAKVAEQATLIKKYEND